MNPLVKETPYHPTPLFIGGTSFQYRLVKITWKRGC